MLTRIYGIAFADAKSLKQHLKMLEEAKKRDHKKLGTKLALFKFYDTVGSGFAVWLPNGAKLRAKLEQLLFKLHQIKGYEPVQGPQILKAELWKTSGHYENYKEFMYTTKADDQEFCIKPMNCLGHIKVFEADLRSYKDLPLRFFEFGTVHRHEKSGVLNGLFRTRGFTQDDAHIFCRPDQIQDEIFAVLDFLSALMLTFDFEYSIELATRPDKFVGSDEIWQTATTAIVDALKAKQLEYSIDEGGGAFYGPKIDIKITDAIGRKWQCGTVQVDFNMPERFNINYVDQDNSKATPVMLHRALLGSFERFIGILIEHYAGEFPFFIAPNQVDIIPINENHHGYAKAILADLRQLNVDARIIDKNESLNKRIRFAETSKTPILLVIGDEELKNQTVAVRNRRTKLKTQTTLKEFLEMVKTMMAINLV